MNHSGINAMSISEISGIPRATVIRKLNKLLKENYLRIDKKKHFRIRVTGVHVKEIYNVNKNTINNFSYFSTQVYNLLKL